MRITSKYFCALAVVLGLNGTALFAGTTIDGTNKYSYGANIGWLDWTGDTNSGAVIGEYVCSGYIYSANVGWINLGSGSPTNGIYYQNGASNDFGVNVDAAGNLRGYAYGANIGWINFETNGAPTVDLSTGKLSGSVWSANCGWISLSNTTAFVQTDKIARGIDSNSNGITDAWEYQNFGALVSAGADPDHDGLSNLQEYLAGTDPNNANDGLRITYVARGDITPNFTTLHWSSKPTRAYAVQSRATAGTNSAWVDSLSFNLGTSNTTFSTGTTNRTEFYRIRAFRPLTP